jgi:hypothetical protein
MPIITTNLSGTTITVFQSGASYQWVKCPAYSIISGETAQNFTATASGDYAVIVTLNGCSDTSACVTVNKAGINNQPKAISNLAIYPNPNCGIFTIKSNGKGFYNVFNELGQIIQSFELNDKNSFTVNIENLSVGVYYISGMNNDYFVTKKVLVIK